MNYIKMSHGGRKDYVKTEKTLEEVEDVFNKLKGTLNIVVGAANTVAGKLLVDLDEWMRDNTTIYRQKVKHHLKMAIRAFEAYEKLYYRDFKDKYEFFLDYLNEAEDELMPDIQRMYFSYKQVMDKAKEPQSELFAKIEVACDMFCICCEVYDRLIDDCIQRTGLNFDPYLNAARLTGSLHWMKELEKLVCHTTSGKNISLADDANSRLAVDVILRRLGDEDVLTRICSRALSYHPEHCSGEDKTAIEAIIEEYA